MPTIEARIWHVLTSSWQKHQMQVIVKKNAAMLEMGDDAKLGDLMQRLSTDQGIEVSKQLGCECLRRTR